MGSLRSTKRSEERGKLDYIAFFEWDPNDWDKLTEKLTKLQEERKKLPDKYPTPITGSYSMGLVMNKGFGLYAADDEDQLINLSLHYWPEMNVKWVPIFKGSKVRAMME